METYFTRLCWNECGWQKPSGSAVKVENKTFNTRYGFGFEEWLFDSQFEIDGIRYGFVQGANKSQRRLAVQDIKLLLYTIAPDKKRYCVGELDQCEVLDQGSANSAFDQFKKDGLIEKMIQDVFAVKGDADLIRKREYLSGWAMEIFNIRFLHKDLVVYPELSPLPKNSRIWKYNRYQLIKADENRVEQWLKIS